MFQAAGLLMQGRSARIAGEEARLAAEFNAHQAEIEAGTAQALAQRSAAEQRRQGDIIASRALAVAAASGGGASDPTMVNIIANIRGESVYRANVAFYEGEARARKLRLHAMTERVSGAEAVTEGANKELGYSLAAAGSAFKGAASISAKKIVNDIPGLYGRYGMGGPGGDSAAIQSGYGTDF